MQSQLDLTESRIFFRVVSTTQSSVDLCVRPLQNKDGSYLMRLINPLLWSQHCLLLLLPMCLGSQDLLLKKAGMRWLQTYGIPSMCMVRECAATAVPALLSPSLGSSSHLYHQRFRLQPEAR